MSVLVKDIRARKTALLSCLVEESNIPAASSTARMALCTPLVDKRASEGKVKHKPSPWVVVIAMLIWSTSIDLANDASYHFLS